MRKVQFVLVALILSLGLIISSAIVSNTIESLKKKDDIVSVKGVAEKKIKSDKGTMVIEVIKNDKDVNVAMEALKIEMANLRGTLKSEDFTDEELKVANVIHEAVYQYNENGYQTNKILSYNVRQAIVINTKKVEKLDPLQVKLSENIGLSVSTPQYFVSNVEKIKIDLLGEATKNAKMRAVELIKYSSGSNVGGIKSVNQGVFQITGDDNSETSDYGYYDTTSIEKTIRAVISIEYRIE